MNSEEVLETLKRTGALQKGHFRLSSGRHSDTYIQCAMLLKHPSIAVSFGEELATRPDTPVELVLCPAVGAVVIGFTVALGLGVDMEFTERVDGGMELRRGFEVPEGSSVLLVEDVVTTGGSIMEVARVAEESGGQVVGTACIVDRGGFDGGGYPLYSLARIQVESYEPESCPMCREGVEMTAPGSRHLRG